MPSRPVKNAAKRPMEDRELISQSQAGDLDSFNQLVEKYQSQVYNLALRMLGNAEAAADATQDTFLAAYRAVGKFRGGNFRAWLLRIAANCCRDQLRAARRRPASSLDLLLESESPPPLVAKTESPEDYALRRELGRAISDGLASLPAEQRLVVILSDIQGLSYEDIAQATRSSLGTVKSRLSRGRERLRDCLLQQRELLPPEFRQ